MIRSLSVILAAGILLSCKKNAIRPTHILADWSQNQTLMVHQAVALYDSTALNDSLLFVQPPTNRIYRWDVLPDSTGVHFTYDYLHGEPDISFDQSGVYRISARIYDSATNREVAETNVFTIGVTTDTLYPKTAIENSDQLGIHCCSVGYTTGDTATTDYFFQLTFTTSDSYIGYSVIPFQISTANGILISFADSTTLQGFPLNFYSPVYQPIQTYVQLQYIPVGSTQPFSVEWLDQTYMGTVSRPATEELTFGWDNSGPVKITP
jgi:hypothetical protein